MKNEILSHLPDDFPWAGLLHWYPSVESTNTMAKAMIQEGAPEGTVLIADCQTGGRGRLGRSFQSPGGFGIYMSVILRPNCPPSELMHLTCASAVAMCDAVEASAGFRPGIKWTNDLVWGRKKLSGILTELVLEPGTGQVAGAVIGVGLNCLQQPVDFPPTLQNMAASLAMVSQREISRSLTAARMIQAFYEMNRNLLTGKKDFMDRYRRSCITLNREVSLVRGDSVRHGRAIDVDDNGALVVRFDSGTTESVSSGEISVRGMYGYV